MILWAGLVFAGIGCLVVGAMLGNEVVLLLGPACLILALLQTSRW